MANNDQAGGSGTTSVPLPTVGVGVHSHHLAQDKKSSLRPDYQRVRVQAEHMAMASRPACAASEFIAKGRDSAALLQALLGQQSAAVGETPHGIWHLTEQILSFCNRALAALQEGTEGTARKRKLEHGTDAPRSKRMRESGGERGIRVEKKWTTEDGHIWRKYGQKEIRDSKYPRLYFRCTYMEDHGCLARRRVQQSDDDPSVYLITYFGEHTCCSDDEEPRAPPVINFGSCSTTDGQRPSGSPWLSCDDDGLVVSETSSEICGLPEGEDLRPDKVSGLIEYPTPVPPQEPEGMRLPGLEPLDGCLDWELGNEILFDFGEFINFDYAGSLQFQWNE